MTGFATVALLLVVAALAALLLVGGFLSEHRRVLRERRGPTPPRPKPGDYEALFVGADVVRSGHAPPFSGIPFSEHPTPPRVPPPKPYKSESNGLTLEEIMALPPRPPEPPDCRVCSHSAGGHLIRKADRGCDVIGCDCTAYEPGAEP